MVRELVERERREIMRNNPAVSHDHATMVAGLALVAVAINTLSHIMYIAKASTLTVEDLATYHPLVPWMSLTVQSILIYASHVKGVRYWLVYAIAGLSVATNLVWIALFHGILQPSDLSWLNHGPDWWTGT